MEKIKNEMIDVCNDIHWKIEKLEAELRESKLATAMALA